jgi:23S rRNA (cytosine1962-C5)-methyltransferase
MNEYELLDSGDLQKLEKFGKYIISRPSFTAVWQQSEPNIWNTVHARFSRKKDSAWDHSVKIPQNWNISLCDSIKLKLSLTSFGHIGFFPEHLSLCKWAKSKIDDEMSPRSEIKVLNLFAYTGMMSVYLAKAGARVCHLDASIPMINWAKENASLNNIDNNLIRWIADDVIKFLKREIKRGSTYDAIILDPPSFGRGTKKELFKIEEDIVNLLYLCKKVLSKNPLFLAFSCHTPGYSPIVCQNLLKSVMKFDNGLFESGEMLIPSNINSLPCGSFARWSK